MGFVRLMRSQLVASSVVLTFGTRRVRIILVVSNYPRYCVCRHCASLVIRFMDDLSPGKIMLRSELHSTEPMAGTFPSYLQLH